VTIELLREDVKDLYVPFQKKKKKKRITGTIVFLYNENTLNKTTDDTTQKQTQEKSYVHDEHILNETKNNRKRLCTEKN